MGRDREADRALGQRVAEARRQAGFSQGTLASGVSLDRTAISKIESGRRGVSSVELARIARTVGRPVQWFLSEPVSGAEDLATLLRRRRQEILRIASRHGVRSVRLFGSAARGEAREDSDIDLLVDMEPARSLLDQTAFLVELRTLLGTDVDVVTEAGLRERIRDRVVREAVPL